MIDLHLHSTSSDGSDTPAELVVRGQRAGLTAMALTDHDTMAGTGEFLGACRAQGMAGIAGIELSAAVEDGQGTLHILGYGMNPGCARLQERLTLLQEGRARRNREILAKLNDAGLKLDWDEVKAHAGEDVVGRPHFAKALVMRDYVSTMREAFERYLAKGRTAYVERSRLSPEECIRLIRESEGVAVIAHPFSWETNDEKLEAGLRGLKALGLAGIEVQHSDYNPEQTVTLLRLAKRLELLKTGGSDFHGSAKTDLVLGRGFGTLCVPDNYLPPLLQALGHDNPSVVLSERLRVFSYELV